MARALALARRGEGSVSPNPMVGAVVVRGGRVVGEGYHMRAGAPHAERIALRRAGARARGADLYVTLEPCNHHGRTGPCTDAVLAAGVGCVVVGAVDPNPQVRGRGIARLRRQGVRVKVGVLREECVRLNEAYNCFIAKGRPFVVLKSAASLDGRIATRTGASQWITSPQSRRAAHLLRGKADAVVVGAVTVRRDDPRLTVRLGRRGRRRAGPLRVVVDSRLSISPRARLLRGGGGKNSCRSPALVATTARSSAARRRRVGASGAEVLVVRSRAGRVDLRDLFRRLARRGIVSVLIEGGGELAASALEQQLVDKVCFFYAPKIIGGNGAKPMVGGRGADRPAGATRLGPMAVRRIGDDLLVEAPVIRRAGGARAG